jgi:hypothetical protein
MKRLLWIVTILLLSISASAQVSGPARKIAFGTSDPAVCQPSGNNIFFNTSSGLLKICTSANTWTTAGPGAGTGSVTHTGTLTANQLIKGNGGVDITVGNLTGDVTTSGSMATTLANTAVTPGSYTSANITVDSKGRLTAAANGSGGGSMSIGGTVTSGTTGSIPFIGAGPVLAQDNATFFWDTTNKRLGIGTTAPASALDVQGFMSLGALNTEGQGIYLASCFTNTQALYLVASNDGKTFNFLNSNDPTTGAVYTPVSPSIVRDPSIMKSGGLYWVAHTNNFGGTTFDVISSPDLSNWTLVQSVDMSAVTGVNRVYAPEWFVDTDGSIHIFVTTSIDTGVSYQIHEVHPTNVAMTTWSTPVTVTGTGIPVSAIDPFILKLGSNYQLWYSNQPTNSFIEVATSTSLTSGYTALHTGDWNSWGNTIEGPNIVQTGTNTYRLYVDHFPSLGIKYAESTDGGSTWGALTAITVPGVIVHPTIIRIRDVDALRNMAGLFMARNSSVNGPFTASAVTTTNGSVVSASHVISGANLYLGTGADAYLILGATSTDTIIGRAAADNFRLGKLAANPPIAQTLSMQNASGTNIAGADFTLSGSQGTGTGIGGSLVLKVAPAGSTGSSLNALATALTILSTKKATFADDLTVSGLLKTGSGPTTLTDSVGKILSAALNDVAFANFVPATAASKLVGRGSASGAGDFEEITLGSGLTMTGTTLSASGGGGGLTVGTTTITGGTTAQLLYDNGGVVGESTVLFNSSNGNLHFAHTKGIETDNGALLRIGGTGNNVSIGSMGFGIVSDDFTTTYFATTNRHTISITSGTVTEAGWPFLDIAGTWNEGSTVLQGIRLNVTNTASAAGSPLLDLQIGSSSLFRVEKSGNVKLGATTARGTTEGTNTLSLFNGTAPVGTLTNGASFYASGGEMFVIDAGGTALQISSHDKDGFFVHDTRYTTTGRRVIIDIEKLARFLNERFGTDFIHEFTER